MTSWKIIPTILNRHNYKIPKNSEIETLFINSKPIRPLIAIIMLYTKIFVKKYILNSNLLENEYYNKFLKEYFPKKFYDKFAQEIENHPLKKEIIATQITNKIINSYGIGLISDFHQKTLKYKIESYLIINEMIEADKLKEEINELKLRNRLEKNIKEEIERMIEFFVITFAKEVLLTKDFDKNNLNKSFKLYIEPKKEEYEDIIKDIKELKKNKSLIYISHLAN